MQGEPVEAFMADGSLLIYYGCKIVDLVARDTKGNHVFLAMKLEILSVKQVIMSCALARKHSVKSIFSDNIMYIQKDEQVIQLVERDMLGFLSVNYQDEKVPVDKHNSERLSRPVVPDIDLDTESVDVDDSEDDLLSNFVTAGRPLRRAQ
eukprot:16430443-Heterocapsa_arctica.AAC.1